MGTDKRARQKELSRTRAEEARRSATSLARRRRIVNLTLVVVAAVAVVGGIFVFTADDDDTATAGDSTATTAVGETTVPGEETTTPQLAEGSAACPSPDGTSEQRRREFDGPPKMCIDPAKKYSAKVETNQGDFTLELDADRAPVTVNNFVFLARYHYYDDLTFHRIIDGFMIQGGDPEGTGAGGPGYDFTDELPQAGEYEIHSVAMANSGPNTNGSQFFIITGEQGVALPPSYSLFGKATDGADVVDKIGKVETDDSDKPLEDVVMKKVTITES